MTPGPRMSRATPARTPQTMSIGELIVALRPEFPDVSISKIRYLEAEGLIEPSRTSSGYRRFTPADVARLRYVLTAQRDQYLPLRVIKDHLAAMDRGELPAPGAGAVVRLAPNPASLGDTLESESQVAADDVVRLTRADLLEQSGIDSALLDELESFGFLSRRTGPTPYDRDALMVASLVRELTTYGVEPRHLRAVKTAADREIGLVQQVVAPLLRRGGPDARARADEAARDLASLAVRLHAALVMAGLRR
jgi:DNA-binding transcriptional MerR regulator